MLNNEVNFEIQHSLFDIYLFLTQEHSRAGGLYRFSYLQRPPTQA